MSRKKQAEEKLINTHVININEIREAEREEKHLRIKKKPILFSILGVLLITLGFAYPEIYKYLPKAENNEVVVAAKDKDILTCISNVDDKNTNLKVYTKTTYKFSNGKLLKSTGSTKMSLLAGTDISIINALKDRYSSIYTSNASVKYNLQSQGNELYINTEVDDYKTIDYNTYNNEINNINHTPIFRGGESIDTVKTTLEQLGNLCR